MVKLRDARYCNLKLLLIFLVIYGHLIEPRIWSAPELMTQYRWIYLFHMPLFSFLSGLFLKNQQMCRSQIVKTLPLYAVFQTVAVFLGQGAVKPLTPFWHLWYLLSYSTWTGLGWLWFRFGRGKGKLLILAASVLLGCLIGNASFVDRRLSLSRTIVFFPYFWMGLICDPEFPWRKLRLAGLLGLCAVIAMMVNGGNEISVVFLYQAAPYGNIQSGGMLRLVCYLLGTLLCLFLLSFIPSVRLPFTRAGGDTMHAYLIHAPFAALIRELGIPWTVYPLITAGFLYAVYKISQWFSPMYGIVPTRKGDSRWPVFKKYMNNTHSRCTDSYYP